MKSISHNKQKLSSIQSNKCSHFKPTTTPPLKELASKSLAESASPSLPSSAGRRVRGERIMASRRKKKSPRNADLRSHGSSREESLMICSRSRLSSKHREASKSAEK